MWNFHAARHELTTLFLHGARDLYGSSVHVWCLQKKLEVPVLTLRAMPPCAGHATTLVYMSVRQIKTCEAHMHSASTVSPDACAAAAGRQGLRAGLAAVAPLQHLLFGDHWWQRRGLAGCCPAVYAGVTPAWELQVRVALRV